MPDLVKICDQVQAAVNRQAEALEGLKTLRPGPYTARTKIECTLDLLPPRKGSTVLPFAIAKPQMALSDVFTIGTQAIIEVASAIESLSNGNRKQIDPGVLASLEELGSVFDRKAVSSIEFIVPKRLAKRRIVAPFTPRERQLVRERIMAPRKQTTVIEGTLEMVDFKPEDHKCRIMQPVGQSVACSFDESKESEVQALLRKSVRVSGHAVIDAYNNRIDSIHIDSIEPIRSIVVGAHEFHSPKSFQELAKQQNVKPVTNIATLAGAFSAADKLDELLEEIYRERA